MRRFKIPVTIEADLPLPAGYQPNPAPIKAAIEHAVREEFRRAGGALGSEAIRFSWGSLEETIDSGR